MMKENIFKYFDNVILSETLNENSANKRTIITDEDELISLFKSDYSEALNQHKQGNNIYRGAKYYLYGYNDLAVMVSPGIRVSQDSVPNVYTILMSEIFHSWKDFPKRNRSHICSLGLDTANKFNNCTYYVFPKNGTKIGVCPDKDIWTSFNTKYDKSAIALSRIIIYIFNLILDYKYELETLKNFFNNSSDTLRLFKEFNEKFVTIDDKKMQEYVIAFTDKYNCTLLSDYEIFVKRNSNKSDFLRFIEQNIFDTKGFITVDISNLGSKIDKRKNLPSLMASQNEVWFEGDAIYMPIEDMYFEWIRDNV